MAAEPICELVDIVDTDDRVIGTALRSDATAQQLRCRIVWIQVIDPHTLDICMIRRGVTLGYKPNAWQFGAGGYVTSGEDWKPSAVRELEEELGLTAPLHYLGKIVGNSEFEGLPFVHGYYVAAGTHAQLQADPREVAAIEFMSLEKAAEIAAIAPKIELTGTFHQTLDLLQREWAQIVEFVKASPQN